MLLLLQQNLGFAWGTGDEEEVTGAAPRERKRAHKRLDEFDPRPPLPEIEKHEERTKARLKKQQARSPVERTKEYQALLGDLIPADVTPTPAQLRLIQELEDEEALIMILAHM